MKQLTIESCHQKKQNSFNFLRFFCASFVIFTHSFGLLKDYNVVASYNFTGQTNAGVLCFFVISGFLITESYLKNINWARYLKNRILRIFPALFISVLFSVFIVGLAATTLTIPSYLNNTSIYSFIIHNITLYEIHYYLPGVFENNPATAEVNGSFWTLPIEFGMYLIICILGICNILRNAICASIMLLVFASIVTFVLYWQPQSSFSHRGVFCVLAFITGSIFYLWKDKIPLNVKSALALTVITFIFYKVKFLRPFYEVIYLINFTYFVFLISYLFPNLGRSIVKHGDVSYGLYIFSYPIQQFFIHRLHNINGWELFMLSYPITLLIAMISWRYVEKPSLSLRSFRLPADRTS